MRRGWLACVLLVGCVDASAVDCGDGRVCPQGQACAVVNSAYYCVDPSRLGCAEDGQLCAEDSTCHEGVCLPNECGNGLVDSTEVCDDGNLVNDDMCSETCTSTNVCGNAIVDPVKGEQCDSGIPGMSGDGCASTCTVEALIWRDITPRGITPRSAPAIAYDSHRGIAVLFGGLTATAVEGDTWQFINSTWTPVITGRSPPGRLEAGMAYHGQRHEMVLFGGISAGFLGDTWVFDGTTWTQRTPATSPSPRAFPVMAYHEDRDELVMFGGFDGTTALGDTWLWNGTTWTQHTGTSHPNAAAAGVMAFDATRREIVYYGSGETWVWNGSWQQRSPGNSPTNLFYDTMAYDGIGGVLVMFGNGKTYTWDGSDWKPHSTLQAPPAADEAVGTYAGADGAIVFGGRDQASPVTFYRDTWTWVGTDWVIVPGNSPSPPPRQGHAMAYDARHGEILMFGGSSDDTTSLHSDTWRYQAGAWSLLSNTGAVQLARALHAMSYDSARDRVMLFGGADGASLFDVGVTHGDTWEWDREISAWSQRASTGPTPRRLAAMAFDQERGETVLFGGAADLNPGDGNTDIVFYDDTWVWNGTAWTQRTSATSPPGREAAGIAYDPVRKRVVLFGGTAGHLPRTLLADTWEWDGATWTKMTPPVSPPARAAVRLAYDPGRQRVILAGGIALAGTLDEVWEWDGATWTQLAPQGSPGPVLTFVYDNVEQRLIAYGDPDYAGTSDDTWALEYTTPLAGRELCIVGTADDDGDGLTGCSDPDCWARCAPLCPPLTTCPMSAPRCGDSVCSPLENSAICPADC